MEKKEIAVVGATVALVLYTLTLSMLGPALSATQQSKTLSNTGSIKAIGVGVYSDQACTTPVTSLSWGVVNPGSNANKTVYIRNEGNTAATLGMATSNWNPLNASSYLTLTWNYSGQTISVNQVLQVKFTLSVSATVTGITNFSFDITITSNG